MNRTTSKKNLGRPKLPEGSGRKARIHFALKESEAEILRQSALKEGLSISQLIRFVLFNRGGSHADK